MGLPEAAPAHNVRTMFGGIPAGGLCGKPPRPFMGGIVMHQPTDNPSVSFADSSLYTREPFIQNAPVIASQARF